MKKIYAIIVFVAIMINCWAQVPQKMSYQAVIRDANGNLLANSNVGIKVSILTGSETGAVVYSETHTKTTNANGLVNLVIGEGTYLSGSFSGIDWSTLSYFIKTETDPDGGTNYTISGTSQLMSVPYAFYAGNSFWASYGSSNIFRSSGNIGIGAYPTDYRLELVQNSTTGKGMRILGGTDSNSKLLSVSSYGTVEVDDHSIEGGRLMIKTGGNVGIGDPNPTEKLVVNGKTKTTNLQVTNGAVAGKVLVSDADGNATWQNQNTYWSPNGSKIYYNSGFIGMGTSNPSYPLHLIGDGANFCLESNTNDASMYIKSVTDRGSIWFMKGNELLWNIGKDANVFYIHRNGFSYSLNISHSNGNVGIKQYNPSNPLSVSGNADISGYLGIGNTAPSRPLSFPAVLGEKILLYPGTGGEVGIGVYSAELRLHTDIPNGKISFGWQDNAGAFTEFGKFEKNGAYALSVFGDIWANGVTYASDERFKKDITPISSPLNKIKQIEGVEYEMKPEFIGMNFSNGRQIGLLAQNIEKIVPEAVVEKDGYKGVDYARLVPLLIESIKEQQKKIETLENRVKNLERN
jgi:hypothetical protein